MTHLVRDHARVTARDEESEVVARDDDTVFHVLAQRAAERSPAQLWTTVIVAATNATFILSQHPKLHWLGAGCVAAAAYGIWGLADRAIGVRDSAVELTEGDSKHGIPFLRCIRWSAAAVGTVSALAAIGSFMAVALSGWIH